MKFYTEPGGDLSVELNTSSPYHLAINLTDSVRKSNTITFTPDKALEIAGELIKIGNAMYCLKEDTDDETEAIIRDEEAPYVD